MSYGQSLFVLQSMIDISTNDDRTKLMAPELPARLVIQTLRTANTLLRESRRLFRPHGLTDAQFNVLNILCTSGEGLTQRELSDILVVDRSNVTGLLDRMEAAGWVRRAAVPGDRRAWRVQVTPAGRNLWQKVFPLYERAIAEAMRPIEPGDLRTTIDALTQLERRAQQITTPGK